MFGYDISILNESEIVGLDMIVVLSVKIDVRIRKGNNPDIAMRNIGECRSVISKYRIGAIEEVDCMLTRSRISVSVPDSWKK